MEYFRRGGAAGTSMKLETCTRTTKPDAIHGSDYHIMPVPEGADAVGILSKRNRTPVDDGRVGVFVLFDAEQTSAFRKTSTMEVRVCGRRLRRWQLRATVDDLRSYSRDRARRQDRQGNEQSRVVSSFWNSDRKKIVSTRRSAGRRVIGQGVRRAR